MFDSGLSAAAPLDFSRSGMLCAEPSEVVTFLARTGQRPDMRGDVGFTGLDDVDPPVPNRFCRKPFGAT